jgi:hypothetical protein
LNNFGQVTPSRKNEPINWLPSSRLLKKALKEAQSSAKSSEERWEEKSDMDVRGAGIRRRLEKLNLSLNIKSLVFLRYLWLCCSENPRGKVWWSRCDPRTFPFFVFFFFLSLKLYNILIRFFASRSKITNGMEEK